MIEFLKNIFKKMNFKSNDEDLNKYNKMIYSVIILCAILFVGFMIYFVIKQWPNFIDAVRYNWNDSKSILNNFTTK